MRFFLIVYLFSLTLAGQATMHVWAESGLTLRAEGKADAEKIGRLNYGSQVTLTGNFGEELELSIFKPFMVEVYDDGLRSLGWKMREQYVEVTYEGQTGWVYGGYLSRFDPPSILNGPPDLFTWLEGIGGQAQKLPPPPTRQNSNQEREMYRYENGILRTSQYGEGWGGTTIAIPFATFNEGFLIAEVLFRVSEQMAKAKSNEVAEDFYILEVAEDQTLQFSDELSVLKITVVGDLLIIESGGGC